MRTRSLSYGSRTARILAALCILFPAWLGLMVASPVATGAELSKETRACLTCHDTPGFSVELLDGSSLPLNIGADAYGKSTHGALDCETCHSQLDVEAEASLRQDAALTNCAFTTGTRPP